MPPVDRYIATAEFYVRYAETDAQGVVHHSSYVVWMEEARSHYARERGSDYADFERTGFGLSVIDLQVRYLAAAHYGELIAARCWVEELRSRTLTFGYEIADNRTGTLFATGQTRHVCITREGKLTTMPTMLKHWLDK